MLYRILYIYRVYMYMYNRGMFKAISDPAGNLTHQQHSDNAAAMWWQCLLLWVGQLQLGFWCYCSGRSPCRSIMKNQRLTGLALLHMDTGIPIDIEKAIDTFAVKHFHCMTVVDMLEYNFSCFTSEQQLFASDTRWDGDPLHLNQPFCLDFQ